MNKEMLSQTSLSELDQNYTLLTVIVNQNKAEKITQYAKRIGIKRYTSFRGKGTATSAILQMLEISDINREVIIFIIPTVQVDEMMAKLTEKFHFEKPSQGILFTVKLSHVLGITHKAPENSLPDTNLHTDLIGMCTIVDKGLASDVLDVCNRDSFLGGTILPAHGSARESVKIFNFAIEPEKELVLMLIPVNKANDMKNRLVEKLNLKDKNSGIFFTFAIDQVRGLKKKEGYEDSEHDIKERLADWEHEEAHYDAIWTIVPEGYDGDVVRAAEKGGSQGATILSARGAHVRDHSLMIADIEPEREVVVVITKREATYGICKEINEKFRLDDPGQGVVFVFPIHEPVGLLNK